MALHIRVATDKNEEHPVIVTGYDQPTGAAVELRIGDPNSTGSRFAKLSRREARAIARALEVAADNPRT